MPMPFPESVAIEKSWNPLPEGASASSRLRRKFFRGETVKPEDGAALGATDGLVGACVKLMTQWGFRFDTSKNEETGKIEYRLENPQHVPTEHKKPEPTGVTRTRKKAEPGEPKGSPVHRAIRERLLSGEPITQGESMAMGASSAFLRKEVIRLKEEGYKFRDTGSGLDRTLMMTKAPGKKSTRPSSKGLASSPVGAVPMNGKHAAQEMLFGELATPPPALGGHIRVIGMMLDGENDDVVLAVSNAQGVWKARVEGYAEPG